MAYPCDLQSSYAVACVLTGCFPPVQKKRDAEAAAATDGEAEEEAPKKKVLRALESSPQRGLLLRTFLGYTMHIYSTVSRLEVHFGTRRSLMLSALGNFWS